MTNTIRQAILDKLNSADVDLIHSAYRAKSTFAGFPAAVVLPSDNESDYGSTFKDRSVFVFRIVIYYPIKKESEQDAVEIALENAVDELLTVFGGGAAKRGVLGAACDWVEPVPAAWGEDPSGETVYRTAAITLRCVKYVG